MAGDSPFEALLASSEQVLNALRAGRAGAELNPLMDHRSSLIARLSGPEADSLGITEEQRSQILEMDRLILRAASTRLASARDRLSARHLAGSAGAAYSARSRRVPMFLDRTG